MTRESKSQSQRSTLSAPSTPVPTSLTSSSTNISSPSSIPATLPSWLYMPSTESYLFPVPTQMSPEWELPYYPVYKCNTPTFPLHAPYINSSSFSIVFINQLIYFMNVLIYHLSPFLLKCKFHGEKGFFSVLFYC